jgi:hypothetical protein
MWSSFHSPLRVFGICADVVLYRLIGVERGQRRTVFAQAGAESVHVGVDQAGKDGTAFATAC